MCRCKYPKVINKNNISIVEDNEGERCYKVSFKVGEEGSNILIIARAPKSVDFDSCDCEYKRIIKFLKKNEEKFCKIKNITIVYLYTTYVFTKEELYFKYLKDGKYYVEGNDECIKNDTIIKEAITEGDYIFCGWGEPEEGMLQIFSNRVEKVLRYIREGVMSSTNKKEVLRVGDLSKKGFPKHSLAWKYNDEIKRLS